MYVAFVAKYKIFETFSMFLKLERLQRGIFVKRIRSIIM